jgi:8-oxo-dGTP pyrophosphatase MutT (NUDIX family)
VLRPDLAVDIARQLAGFDDDEASQRAVAEAMLAFVAARSDAWSRSCVPGHFTASTLVVDASRKRVLLTLHRRLGRWLQLGGHIEPGDASVAAAALREATEESGIDHLDLDPAVVHLDVHPLTCSLGVPTRHLDLRFVAIAPPDAEPAISEESSDLAWFGYDRLPPGAEGDLGPLLERARRRLASRRAAT